MNLNNRILVFSYDAGGANLAMAYAYYMNNKGYEVRCFPKGPAVKIFENHIPDLISKENIIFKSTDIIATGTSGIHSDYEMKIIKDNKYKVLKCISFLDSLANLEVRFSINSKLLDKKFFPHELWYEGEIVKELDLVKDCIVSHENLYLKYLKDVYYKEKIVSLNTSIIKHRNKYILILTEYISELYGDIFGFNEFDFLDIILKNLDKFNVPIFLKLHPAEKSYKYDKIISKYNKLKIYKEEFNIQEVLYNAKLVLGLNSSVFRESLLINKPTYSIQIGATKKLDTIEPVKVINTESELVELLEKVFKG